MMRAASAILFVCWLVTLASLAHAQAPDAASPPTPAESETTPPTAPVDAKKAEAKVRFERGVELLVARSYDAALNEFLQSRELAPTRAATENAAVCLVELRRLDEAAEMFDALVAEFPDLPEAAKARVDAQQRMLATKLGAITVLAERGASISVDARSRGQSPQVKPLRATVGSHVVAVHLDGYAPFVTSVQVVAGKTAVVRAKLEVLAASGRLKIVEKKGRIARVIVDGVPVGDTPVWEGAIAPGDHAVWLQGGWNEGTPPGRAKVLLGQRTQVDLELRELDAAVAIRITPPTATVSLDGVPVGAGAWEGRLPSGAVEVTVSSAGYVTQTRNVTLEPGGRAEARFDLQPVQPEQPAEASAWEVAVGGALAVAPALGGPSSCPDGCDAGPWLGLHVEAEGAFRTSSGFGIGLGVGYARLTQSTEARSAELRAPGRPAQSASIDDGLLLSGATVTATASYRVGVSPFLILQLGGGGFFGAANDERSYASVDSTGNGYDAGPYHSSGTVIALTMLPEIRAGFAPIEHIEMWLGVGGALLFPLVAPTWSYVDPVPAGADGATRFTAGEEILGSVVGAFLPALGASLSL